MTAPSTKTVLSVLTMSRLTDVGCSIGVSLPGAKKDERVPLLAETGRVDFRGLLAQLQRDELKAACRAQDLCDPGDSGAAWIEQSPRKLVASHVRGNDTGAYAIDATAALGNSASFALLEPSVHEQEWIESKSLPPRRVGRPWKFQLSRVDAWIEAGGAAETEDHENNG